MRYIQESTLTTTSTNAVDIVYDDFDTIFADAVALNKEVVLNDIVYKARQPMGALVSYIHSFASGSTVDPSTDTAIVDHIVDLVDGVTTIYVEGTAPDGTVFNNYWIATATVTGFDLSSENISSPAKFVQTSGYRYTLNSPLDTPIYWLDTGAINSARPFDKYINTQAEADDILTYEFSTGSGDTFAFFNLDCHSIKIEIWIDGAWVTTHEDDLLTSSINDWEDYFFGELEYRNDYLAFGTQVATGTFKVSFIRNAGVAKVGKILFGRSVDLGATLMGVSYGIDDYSIKDVNDAGNSYLKVGAYSKRADLSVNIDNTVINTMVQRLTKLRGTAVVWIGDERTDNFYEGLLVYGYYQNFSMVINNQVNSEYTLELKGLI